MEVHASAATISADALDRSAADRIVRGVMASLLILLLATTLVLWSRRAAGALHEPLSPAVLLLVGTLLALGSAVVRWLACARMPGGIGSDGAPVPGIAAATPSRSQMLKAGSSVCLVLLAGGLSLSSTTVVGLAALWAPLAIGELVGWSLVRRHGGLPWRGEPENVPLAARTDVTVPATRLDALATDIAAVSELSEDLEVELEDEMPPDEVSQKLVRSRDVDGRETMAGIVRADFEAGQRTANAHVAFCPPFSDVPECFAQQVAGPAAQVKIAHVLAYGLRIDVRLDGPHAEPERVTIEFVAREREQPINQGAP